MRLVRSEIVVSLSSVLRGEDGVLSHAGHLDMRQGNVRNWVMAFFPVFLGRFSLLHLQKGRRRLVGFPFRPRRPPLSLIGQATPSEAKFILTRAKWT